ncbi:hypothetical protein C4D39_11015 [Clostridium perfringens]|nr:hypothetical protein CLO5623_02430 [Clostridium perfringens]
MFNITIFFTTIVFILNALLLYKILKNRKVLLINSVEAINLNNIRDKLTDKLLVPILFSKFFLFI